MFLKKPIQGGVMLKKLFILSAFSLFLSVIISLSGFAQEQPRVISALEGQVPSDAVVLFDGTNLSEWTYTDGKPAGWTVSGGAMAVKGGGIMTKKEFGNIQLHIEFATPAEVKGEG